MRANDVHAPRCIGCARHSLRVVGAPGLPPHATPVTAKASLLIVATAIAGCDHRPEFVFVLEAPQVVELAASASVSRVRVGEAVVLYAQRGTRGSWKRIASRELGPHQCWMAALPPEKETAVADNLHWVVDPPGLATFNTDFRSDHTRAVVLSKEGVFSFTASTSVWCEPGRSVPAPPLHIEAVAR